MAKASEKSTAGVASGSKMHNTLVYFRQHWQLYLIFIMPAFLLTIIFKYLPMGGILIAFTEYNPIKGILGSEWVGLQHFSRFLSSPDFMSYLMNTLKLSVYGLLWGFPIPILLAFLLNRILSTSIKQKIQLVLYMPNFISVIVLGGIDNEGPYNSAVIAAIIAVRMESKAKVYWCLLCIDPHSPTFHVVFVFITFV